MYFNGDITTTSNLDHLMKDLDSTRSNMMVIIIIKYPFMIMEVVRTYSDETGNEIEADEAWTEGTDTKWRFTIKLLSWWWCNI